jgi:hypothetical protein
VKRVTDASRKQEKEENLFEKRSFFVLEMDVGIGFLSFKTWLEEDVFEGILFEFVFLFGALKHEDEGESTKEYARDNKEHPLVREVKYAKLILFDLSDCLRLWSLVHIRTDALIEIVKELIHCRVSTHFNNLIIIIQDFLAEEWKLCVIEIFCFASDLSLLIFM